MIKEFVKNFYWKFNGRALPLGVGCAWVGRDTGGKTKTAEVSLLNECYGAGLRYFDTSRAYGDSELVVGELIKNIGRDAVFLATKTRLAPDGPDHGFELFKRHFYESFDRLKTDRIDLLQIHDTDNYRVCAEKAMPFLRERRREGMISYIGLATRSLTALSHAAISGEVGSVLSYLDYNLIRGSAGKVAKLAAENGVMFANASVLGFGLFTGEKPDENVCPDKLKLTQALAMRELCEKMDVDITAAALQYSTLDPDIDMLLNGIRAKSDLESTKKAMGTHIYPEQWAAIRKLQKTFPNFYIQDEY
jgi:D-threo-aldose 1-dehydrogenase